MLLFIILKQRIKKGEIMIQVKNKKISMYEGDTGEFPVTLIGDLEEGDKLEFRIKENLDDISTVYSYSYDADSTVVISITSSISALLTNDTTGDKTYYYGFKFKRGTYIDTVLGVGEFIIKKGV